MPADGKVSNKMIEDEKLFLGFTPYQWFVLFAAWLGWGFDVFDGLLFNFVSRLCIPSLLGAGHNDPQTITWWSGAFTSVLLLGWAFGGILFGWVTDKIGRSKTLLITILIYAVSTAACAFVTSIYALIPLRLISSLGIGGEWAAGASLVAEVMPEKKRVQGGALLYTAAPAGLFLATFVTDLFTRQIGFLADKPDLAWRVVFLTGLIPAAFAVIVRWKLKEPEAWLRERERVRLRELFSSDFLWKTLGGLAMASVALISWWSCNAFIPVVASFLANDLDALPAGITRSVMQASFVRTGTLWFNLGGLIGTLCTIPIALRLGRRPMFFIYYALSAIAIFGVFRADVEPHVRLMLFSLLGLTVFGVFGSFTFYLPELFPTRIRATGAGFCYNTGRVVTAAGPFLVGYFARTASTSADILSIISWVAVVPALGVILLLLGLAEETRVRKPA